MKINLKMKLLFKCYNALRFVSRRMSSQDNLVAVCQMTAKNDKVANLKTCKKLIEKASERGAKMVFLPEACDYLGESRKEILQLAESLDGPLIHEYRKLAKSCNVWISLGGIHEKASEEKVRNSHVIINSGGDIEAVYHKTHLFDVELPEKNLCLKESEFVERGQNIVSPLSSPVGRIGLSVCYDMRFPELSIVLRRMGADILTFPSAFTHSTGASHWEVLLRARAIETQCYVIAAAQTGTHNLKRSSWGHAMIVDPWGTVIAQCSEGVGIAMAVIDLKNMNSVRSNMPLWQHRRYDLYPQLGFDGKSELSCSQEVYQFGEHRVKSGQVFFETNYSFAFTNKRCVLPGHVLVASKRAAERLGDLNHEEVSDLFLTVTKVQQIVEKCYEGKASTISLQDGADAGQTVKHVHVHILPRKNGDFPENDEVYSALAKHDKVGVDRKEFEMFEEADMLRKLFC